MRIWDLILLDGIKINFCTRKLLEDFPKEQEVTYFTTLKLHFILQARLASATAYSLPWHCPASTRFLWLIVAAERPGLGSHAIDSATTQRNRKRVPRCLDLPPTRNMCQELGRLAAVGLSPSSTAECFGSKVTHYEYNCIYYWMSFFKT